MMVAEIVSVDDATPNFTLERTASSVQPGTSVTDQTGNIGNTC
jgi:hypothetical protein